MLYLPREMPADAVERFARHAAPPIDSLGAGEIHGWVTGRHLLDRRITRDTAYHAGFLRLTLMQAERKIPEPLLRAECRMMELAHMQAEGTDAISLAHRREIRRQVTERLLPQMPPTLRGIHMLYDPTARLLYTTALSDKQLDAFQIGFSQAVGFAAIPVLPETASLRRRNRSIKDWTPVSFSPETEPDAVSHDPGLDFLTWLWFASEARGGSLKLKEIGDWALLIDGPLTFVMEGAGAHEAVIRRGEPRLSAEAKAALLSGKKLRRAKLTLARGDESWTCIFDGPSFVIRSLRLPEIEKLDAVSRFQERLRHIDLFKEALLTLFDRFCVERESKDWARTLIDIHQWVKTRKTRK
jgi:recombination associated protein RdgC